MADKPRTFEEVAAAEDPTVRERMERAELYRDPAVKNDFHAAVVLHEDRKGNGEWLVSYQDDDGAIYLNVFSGPEAEEAGHTVGTAVEARAGFLDRPTTVVLIMSTSLTIALLPQSTLVFSRANRRAPSRGFWACWHWLPIVSFGRREKANLGRR
jgi:hypothetical protein